MLRVRCLKHHLVPSLNQAEAGGGECPICYLEKLETSRRKRLPDERQGITQKFTIHATHGSVDLYVNVGIYPVDHEWAGRPGEIFVTMSKAGSAEHGFIDAWAQAVSVMLQYGIKLELICEKFSHLRFEPSGNTQTDYGWAKSPVDLIARWLERKFLSPLKEGKDRTDIVKY